LAKYQKRNSCNKGSETKNEKQTNEAPKIRTTLPEPFPKYLKRPRGGGLQIKRKKKDEIRGTALMVTTSNSNRSSRHEEKEKLPQGGTTV